MERRGVRGTQKSRRCRAECASTQARRSVGAPRSRLGLPCKKTPQRSAEGLQDGEAERHGFARGHAQFGNQKSFLSRLDEVQDPLDKAIQLNPYHPARGYFYWGKGRGYAEQAVRSNDLRTGLMHSSRCGTRRCTTDGLVQPLLSGRRARFRRKLGRGPTDYTGLH